MVRRSRSTSLSSLRVRRRTRPRGEWCVVGGGGLSSLWGVEPSLACESPMINHSPLTRGSRVRQLQEYVDQPHAACAHAQLGKRSLDDQAALVQQSEARAE